MVIAPGSRNAPLIIAFTNDANYQCISVVDERAAAFTALGISLQKKEPVAVVCSSGSAAVNFYPAVVEAFYQKLPLIVITADRPLEVIDQAVGQTIRQQGLFANHILFEANLLRNPQDELSRSYNQRLINEAMHASYQGPVHINVPFDEPLYDTVEMPDELVKFIERPKAVKKFSIDQVKQMARLWNESARIIVMVGQHSPDRELNEVLNQLNDTSPFLVLSETISNINTSCNICSTDRLINTITEEQLGLLAPDLLITIGGEVVSKMIKKYFGKYPPKMHWHIGEENYLSDTFRGLTHHLDVDPQSFFEELQMHVEGKESHYRDFWIELDNRKSEAHQKYLGEAPFSDFQAFGHILEHLPPKSVLHTANSTTVRYAQLFDHRKGIVQYANRGTSGIDGCTSTAIGHAISTDKMVTLISGDVAFLYDSNAFWNTALPPNLRIIVINNNGGNIFRIIEGPQKDEIFERFQETTHQLNLKGVADIYDLDFQTVSNDGELRKALPDFFEESEKPRILEVKTPRLESPAVLKEYFGFLRKHNPAEE